jgi:TPR repeat protein
MRPNAILFLITLGAMIQAAPPPAEAEKIPDFIDLSDPSAEIKVLQAGAFSGDAKYQCEYAKRLLNGNGLERNIAEAIKWFVKSAEQGNADAQASLGSIYWLGQNGDIDYVKSYGWYLMAANQGHSGSEYLVGYCLTTGTGTPQDIKLGATWYLKSARHGEMRGQYSIACCYNTGRGMERNEEEAIAWFRKAADQGHAESINVLACKHLLKGEIDFAKAYAKKTADKGNDVGQFLLGYAIINSPGGRDSTEAAQLLLKSATQGNNNAQLTVGEAYLHNGLAGIKDTQEAIKWLQKSAIQGNPAAQFWLSGCYITGNGTPKDEIEAYALLNLSAVSYPKAKTALNALEKLISPDARIAGQQRSKQIRAFIEKNQKDKDGELDSLLQSLREAEQKKERKGA